ncbi:hypothetical protein DHEL01_v200750 [Diaporthe helianthi]|uniref:Uncharacterized protein n=1 Tax=Diaporthe helianthi TaxID=158607 RepID=A0A2P5IEB3_DIAHE|nr:hypothetical protein DHEL01_v200750 [Diaporthe helianthi]
MCIQETRLHAICNHAAVDRIECSDKCAHFDCVEIQLSTYCQSCRQQVDNTAILNSVLRWKLGPCPARRRKIRPVKINLLEVPHSPCTPGTAKPPTRHARKLSATESLSALRGAASAPPTRELPPTPPTTTKRLNARASVENLAASLDRLGLVSPAHSVVGSRYSLDATPGPPTIPSRRRASDAFDYVAGVDGQLRLARAHTLPKSKACSAVPQRPATRIPIRDATPRPGLDFRSPRPSPQQVAADKPRPISGMMARDADTDTNTTRPSTANTTSTTTMATSVSTSTSTSTRTRTNTNDAPKSALLQQTPSYPPPAPAPALAPPQQRQPQETQQPMPVSTSVPRSLWSLRRSRLSARSLALASTKEYVHAKLCRGPLPSPSTPVKNLLPAPQQQQQQQRKKPIDIHDPEWLASHGLKWDARGLGLVSTAM